MAGAAPSSLHDAGGHLGGLSSLAKCGTSLLWKRRILSSLLGGEGLPV